MDYCQDHIEIVKGIEVIKERVITIDKRINGSIDDIQKHIEHGQGWRAGIIGVALMVIIQTLILASMWGRLCKTVEVNSERVKAIEDLHPRLIAK